MPRGRRSRRGRHGTRRGDDVTTATELAAQIRAEADLYSDDATDWRALLLAAANRLEQLEDIVYDLANSDSTISEHDQPDECYYCGSFADRDHDELCVFLRARESTRALDGAGADTRHDHD